MNKKYFIIVIIVLFMFMVVYNLKRNDKIDQVLGRDIKISSFEKFISIKKVKFNINEESYIIILPYIGCPKCKDFLDVLNNTSYKNKLNIFLPYLRGVEYNQVKLKCKNDDFKINVFVPRCKMVNTKMFRHGVLLAKIKNGKMISIKKIINAKQFNEYYIEKKFKSME
ncbi:MAG: hypothetical protein ACTSUC_05940 [Promethearchaeota archaeon]